MTRSLVAVHVLVLLVVVGSGFAVSQAIAGRAAAWRPVQGQVSSCPAASTERTP